MKGDNVYFIIKCPLVILLLSIACNSFSQDARSLFVNGNGVNIDSKNESTEKSAATKNTKKNIEAKDYSGISYSMFQKMNDGDIKKISPQKKFKTGDQIKISIRINKKGYLSIINIDPSGKLNLLEEKNAIPNSDINIPDKGFLKFSGEKGIEQLVILLSSKPFNSSNTEAKEDSNTIETIATACDLEDRKTRSLVVSDDQGNQFNVISQEGKCLPLKSPGNTRSLKVELNDDTGYGVIPTTDLKTGQILALKIKLYHE